tara:strand:- start:928 stop:1962 length:1035 start_codon:yes stop_codon:yes gene_type:complete
MKIDQNTNITIFGGTGFIGHSLVKKLAQTGATLRIAARHPQKAYDLRPNGRVGQIVPLRCTGDKESVERAVKGADIVINLVGILHEPKKYAFQKAHVELPDFIAQAASEHNVERFIHISALGIRESASKYAASKRDGEDAIMQSYPTATIIRPSIVFGPGDSFFNMFARMSMILPALPLIGGGQTKFQPVYVEDVTQAIMQCLQMGQTRGQILSLGGPEVLSFKQLMKKMMRFTGRKRALMSLPWGIARVQASILSLFPKPLLTNDQVTSLKTDNIVKDGDIGLSDLGITPTPLDCVLPSYLSRFKPGGERFSKDEDAAPVARIHYGAQTESPSNSPSKLKDVS